MSTTRVAPVTAELQSYIDAHKGASRHRDALEASSSCACYFCFRTFPVTSIKTWIDAGQTALCPACGVDAVLGNAESARIDDRFLRKMHGHHFLTRSK